MTPELTAWIAALNALDFAWPHEVAQLDLLRSGLPALLKAALAAEYARGLRDNVSAWSDGYEQGTADLS